MAYPLTFHCIPEDDFALRVLQVIDSLQIGGAETFLRDLALGLNRRGVHVEVYQLRHVENHLTEELLKRGIPVLSSGRRSLYSWGQVTSLIPLLESGRYDIVHVHLFPAQLWVAVAAVRAGVDIPLVTTEHNTRNRRRRRVFRPMDTWMYRQYRAILAISEAVAASLAQFIPSIQSRLHVINNGIDLERFSRAAGYDKRCLIGHDAPLVVAVSRFDPPKDHQTLIRAVAGLPGVHAVLVGDGPLRSRTEQLAKRLGVSDRIHFLGRRSDVPSILRTADVFVQSSRWEGFGLATVEAMACGLPVVASKVPGLADVVGDAGLLFEPGDAEELRALVARLLTNSDLRLQLGKRAKERASRFCINGTVDAYHRFYCLLTQ